MIDKNFFQVNTNLFDYFRVNTMLFKNPENQIKINGIELNINCIYVRNMTLRFTVLIFELIVYLESANKSRGK